MRQITAQGEDDFVNREYPRMQADFFEKEKDSDIIGWQRSKVWKHASPTGLYRNAQALVSVEDSLLDQFFALSIPKTFIYGQNTFPSNLGEVSADTPLPDYLHAHGVNTEVVPNAGHGQMFDNLDGFANILSTAAL